MTHRVVNVEEAGGEPVFTTKGDANDQSDSEPVRADEVVGRVTFRVPLVGYLVNFANTRIGLASLVIVPAVLLGVSELWTLYRDVASREGDRGSEGDGGSRR